MQGIILLNYNENTRQVEEEEKTRFLRSILEQMGIPIQDFWTSDDPMTVHQKIQLRSILSTYNIQVINDGETLQVYFEGEKIAEWEKPTYKIKKNLEELDPRRRVFLEMTVNCSSVFNVEDAPP